MLDPVREHLPRPASALLRAVLLLALGAGTVLLAPGAQAVPAPGPASDNPLAGREWGVYQGPLDQVWAPYSRATGHRRELLAKIALQPRSKWFGAWIPTKDVGGKIRTYLDNASGGDPEVVVPLTIFAMQPWEDAACSRLPTAKERRTYRRWTDAVATAIGDSRVAMVLQPDGPFALCAPGGSKAPSRLIGYSAAVYGALARTSVYLDAGAADWLRDDPTLAADILVPAGIEHVRGFALASTHYDSTAREIRFGTKVVHELARRGVAGRHFVVNTAANGRPFAGYTYDGPNYDNARVCATRTETRCVTLGIPPTADVANEAWGLNARNQRRARRHVDGYVWVGRPWLYMQADPFVMKRALAVARTSPY